MRGRVGLQGEGGGGGVIGWEEGECEQLRISEIFLILLATVHPADEDHNDTAYVNVLSQTR